LGGTLQSKNERTVNLQAGLSVRVVGWFELDVRDTNLLEELSDDSHQGAEVGVFVYDESFDLVELGQVCSVKSLVTKNAGDINALSYRSIE
jgi:hypothetical protein